MAKRVMSDPHRRFYRDERDRVARTSEKIVSRDVGGRIACFEDETQVKNIDTLIFASAVASDLNLSGTQRFCVGSYMFC